MTFAAGKVDFTSPYFLQIPILKDLKTQAPEAICQLMPSNVNRNVMFNREAPPFNNPELLRAAWLSVDRKAFIDILTEGKGNIGGAMLPPPEGVWGMPPDMLKTLPGYDPDVPKNRAEARTIMEKLGYGPDKRLAATVLTRNIAPYRTSGSRLGGGSRHFSDVPEWDVGSARTRMVVYSMPSALAVSELSFDSRKKLDAMGRHLVRDSYLSPAR
jgi:ABC-type transport system substrate-binding protein